MLANIGIGAETKAQHDVNFSNVEGTVNRVFLAFGGGGTVSFSSITYNYGCELADPSISLKSNKSTVDVGGTASLTATPKYVDGLSPIYSYSSSDNTIATVEGEGLSATVTGVANGTARITVNMRIDETNYSAYVDITVQGEYNLTATSGTMTGAQFWLRGIDNTQLKVSAGDSYNSDYVATVVTTSTQGAAADPYVGTNKIKVTNIVWQDISASTVTLYCPLDIGIDASWQFNHDITIRITGESATFVITASFVNAVWNA